MLEKDTEQAAEQVCLHSPARMFPAGRQHSCSPCDGFSPVDKALDFSVGLASHPHLPHAATDSEQVFTSSHEWLAASRGGKTMKLCALNEQVKSQICVRVKWV